MDTFPTSRLFHAETSDDVDNGNQSDTGPVELWNPHVSLKPSEEDGDASDGKIIIEDDLSYDAMFQVNDNLIKMLIKMEDACDLDWLPQRTEKDWK